MRFRVPVLTTGTGVLEQEACAEGADARAAIAARLSARYRWLAEDCPSEARMHWGRLVQLALSGLLTGIISHVANAKICIEGSYDVAVLVANQNYRPASSDVATPKNDVEAVAAALSTHGWKVLRWDDLKLAQMKNAQDLLGFNCGPRSILFYYAGEGMTVDGIPYVAPVDLPVPKPGVSFAKRNLVAVEDIAKNLSAWTKTLFLVIDGTALPDSKDAPPVFLKRLADIPKVKFAVFSAAPGQAVLDMVPSRPDLSDLSPFARAFAKAVKDKWPDVDAVMLQVREEVAADTAGQQVPDWYRAIGASKPQIDVLTKSSPVMQPTSKTD
jgi:hypothetical protein